MVRRNERVLSLCRVLSPRLDRRSGDGAAIGKRGGYAATDANWFYCDDPKGYLPYVSDCKKDWRAVPSMPPPNANQGTK